MERSSVVLPQPEGPTSTMNSPSSIVRSTSSTATTPPVYSFVTPSRTISATARHDSAHHGPVQSLPYARTTHYDGHMPPRDRHVQAVAEGVLCVKDTCNVYVLRNGSDAVLIDFGSGAALELREELGVERFTDVLLTHHHRDQVQGLARAVEAGIRIWAPPVERDLIDRVHSHWLEQTVDNQYDLTQDRFSLLEEVPVDGVVAEYRTRPYGGIDVYTLPTPGHTAGSVSYLATVAGRRLAFTGDLLYGPGQVWSLAATQWTISGTEGTASTSLSLALVDDLKPDVLLPSHGEPIEHPAAAIGLTRARIEELMNLRREHPWDLDAWLRHPWTP